MDEAKETSTGNYYKNCSQGYISAYRSMMDKGFYKDSEYVHLWLHLLFKANFKENEVLFNGKALHIQPGQFITGRKALARETGIHESKVERILKTFKNEHMIEHEGFNKFRIISITNWNIYQNTEQQDGQRVNSKRTASEQPANTNNNDNNEKKNTCSNPSDFERFWLLYPKRQGKKSALQSWNKIDFSLHPVERILSALERQKQSEAWTKDNGKFVPLPATWLNGERWLDEIDGILPQEGITFANLR